MFGMFRRHQKQLTDDEYLREFHRLIREVEDQFAIGDTPYEQLAKIHWSLDEIIACGRELEQQGESGRSATEAVDYLVARVVDWCQIHPRTNDDA